MTVVPTDVLPGVPEPPVLPDEVMLLEFCPVVENPELLVVPVLDGMTVVVGPPRVVELKPPLSRCCAQALLQENASNKDAVSDKVERMIKVLIFRIWQLVERSQRDCPRANAHRLACCCFLDGIGRAEGNRFVSTTESHTGRLCHASQSL